MGVHVAADGGDGCDGGEGGDDLRIAYVASMEDVSDACEGGKDLWAEEAVSV